jgi:hypothetical protein
MSTAMVVMEKSHMIAMRRLLYEKEVTNRFALPTPKAVNSEPLA